MRSPHSNWDDCLFYLIFSFLIVAFGQPVLVPGLGAIAAAFGFAFFWKALLRMPSLKKKFLLSWLWFASVQAIQLSWLASTEYMGPLIYAVYAFLCLGIGAQFGFLCILWARFQEKRFWLSALACSGFWVLLEWSRTFFFTGFTWNPVGLSLADSGLAIQWASVFGIYGLSFWVVLTNFAALRTLEEKKKTKPMVGWLSLAAFPYLFGFAQQSWIQSRSDFSQPREISVALLQPALLPEQRDFFEEKAEAFIPPIDQWERMIRFFDAEKKVDLIIFPETAFPYGAARAFYPFELVENLWESNFGTASLSDLPVLASPFAAQSFARGLHWKVSNAFLAQALSNHFKADLIIGLDDQDFESGKKYNAAFHFSPRGQAPQRYEKRTLVPISEYIPLQGWGLISQFVAEQFGIYDSFHAGDEGKLFKAPIPVGVSICIEETYGSLMRDLRQQGAEVFVNVTNDVWFPGSRLPKVHCEHARIRGVENGVCSLRACNTGITTAIDCFGRGIKKLPASESQAGILYLSLPLKNYATLYTFWGDGAILAISLALGFGFLPILTRRKSCPK